MSATSPGSVVDRKSTRLNSSHLRISYAVFCLKKNRQKLRAATRVDAPVLNGCDEFPCGDSWRGCHPAEPASASPTGDDSQQSFFLNNGFPPNFNFFPNPVPLPN